MKKLMLIVILLVLLPFSDNNLAKEEIASPSDHITRDNIIITDKFLILSIDNSILADFKDTGSMMPVLNQYSTGIEIVPKTEDEIKIGDIIVYQKDNERIIHRVKYIKEENGEKTFVLKGDNDNKEESVKFADIKYILVGVLY